MKKERRHELQNNTLLTYLLSRSEKSRAKLQPHFRVLGLVAFGCVCIPIVWWFVTQGDRSPGALSWQAKYAAALEGNAALLREVGKDHPDSSAELWARKTAADMELFDGNRSLFVNRDDAETALREAIKDYEYVIEKTPKKSLLWNQATFGLAQSHESLSEVETAIAQYEKVAASASGTSLGRQARDQMDYLKQPVNDAFYLWFKDQEPQPPAASGTAGTGLGGGSPNPTSELENLESARPDLSFPGADTLELDLDGADPNREDNDAAPAATETDAGSSPTDENAVEAESTEETSDTSEEDNNVSAEATDPNAEIDSNSDDAAASQEPNLEDLSNDSQ